MAAVSLPRPLIERSGHGSSVCPQVKDLASISATARSTSSCSETGPLERTEGNLQASSPPFLQGAFGACTFQVVTSSAPVPSSHMVPPLPPLFSVQVPPVGGAPLVVDPAPVVYGSALTSVSSAPPDEDSDRCSESAMLLGSGAGMRYRAVCSPRSDSSCDSETPLKRVPDCPNTTSLITTPRSDSSCNTETPLKPTFDQRISEIDEAVPDARSAGGYFERHRAKETTQGPPSSKSIGFPSFAYRSRGGPTHLLPERRHAATPTIIRGEHDHVFEGTGVISAGSAQDGYSLLALPQQAVGHVNVWLRLAMAGGSCGSSSPVWERCAVERRSPSSSSRTSATAAYEEATAAVPMEAQLLSVMQSFKGLRPQTPSAALQKALPAASPVAALATTAAVGAQEGDTRGASLSRLDARTPKSISQLSFPGLPGSLRPHFFNQLEALAAIRGGSVCCNGPARSSGGCTTLGGGPSRFARSEDSHGSLAATPPRSALPGPPRWAPGALPARLPSGDWAADTTEALLARKVDPFGEHDHSEGTSSMCGASSRGAALVFHRSVSSAW